MTNFEAADKLKDIRFQIVELKNARTQSGITEHSSVGTTIYYEYMEALALGINALYAQGDSDVR